MVFKKKKNKEGVRGIWAIKHKKYVAGKYIRARAPLAREYTNRIFESKDGTTSMKIVNYIERHNFCWNDLLTKSNRTEIQTYKVEERTFGTPCMHHTPGKKRVKDKKTEKKIRLRKICFKKIRTWTLPQLELKVNTSIHWTTSKADNSSLKEVYIPSLWWLAVFRDDFFPFPCRIKSFTDQSQT